MSDDLTLFDYPNRFNPSPSNNTRMTNRQEDVLQFLFRSVERIFNTETTFIFCTSIGNVNQLMRDAGDVYHSISLIDTYEKFEAKINTVIRQVMDLSVRADIIILSHFQPHRFSNQ